MSPEVLPDTTEQERTDSGQELEPGYAVICWNDPVNLMTYVTHVFMRVFGWPKGRAERHMLEVHEQGRSLLIRDSLERAEFYVHRLQHYGLQATLERESA